MQWNVLLFCKGTRHIHHKVGLEKGLYLCYQDQSCAEVSHIVDKHYQELNNPTEVSHVAAAHCSQCVVCINTKRLSTVGSQYNTLPWRNRWRKVGPVSTAPSQAAWATRDPILASPSACWRPCKPPWYRHCQQYFPAASFGRSPATHEPENLQVSELQCQEHCMHIEGLLTVMFNSGTLKLLYWSTKHWARSWNLASVSVLHQT